jgi:hypothetical protein
MSWEIGVTYSLIDRFIPISHGMGRRISKTSVMIFREMNTISWIGAC